MIKFLVGAVFGAGVLFYFNHRPLEQEKEVSTYIAKRAPKIQVLASHD